MIGKGYPAPRHKFRWCTMRLKINPSNAFIKSMVHKNGEAIVILGTRSAESIARAKVIAKYKEKRVREKLSPNGSLPNCFVYSPIEDWSNDDVWQFLMLYKNPWNHDNKSLLTMYQGASEDGECPLVVDTNTQSCGDSRFGCWVCTLVDKDKSMTAMIQNDQDKEWMLPLLEFRNEMDFRGKEDAEKKKRDFRRMGGQVNFNKFDGKTVRGPYAQPAREDWLRRLLEAQKWIRKHGPEEVREINIITLDELREIRRIWLVEKHEFEDNLPKIYKEITGVEFPDDKYYNLGVGSDSLKILKNICGENRIQYEMIRELLDVEHHYRTMTRRSGLFSALENAIKRSYYEDIEDAVNIAKYRYESKQKIRDEFAPEEIEKGNKK
jgi:DNA sulfur modification protein DndC